MAIIAKITKETDDNNRNILLLRRVIYLYLQKNTKKSSIKPVARFNIKGIDNKKILNGVLPVRGAKNAVLKAQAASLLFSDEICVNNSPLIDDVSKMNELLEDLGVEVKRISARSFVFKQPKTC